MLHSWFRLYACIVSVIMYKVATQFRTTLPDLTEVVQCKQSVIIYLDMLHVYHAIQALKYWQAPRNVFVSRA
jgi:hypothetical protein